MQCLDSQIASLSLSDKKMYSLEVLDNPLELKYTSVKVWYNVRASCNEKLANIF